MTPALRSTIQASKRSRFWAAIGGPVDFWSMMARGGRELSWVIIGKFALMGSNATLMLLLANRLELKWYGMLVITISGQLLISRLLMVGIDAGMVRLTAIPELRARYQDVVSAGFVTMASTSGLLLIVSLLAMLLFSQAAMPAWVIGCIAAGSIGTALVDYGYSFRLSRQDYPSAAFTQGGTAIWRLGLTTAAAVMLKHPAAVLAAYHGASLLSGLVQSVIIAPANWRRPDRSLIQRLLRYSFWQGQANVIVVFSLYQGTFLLMLLKQPAETGIFGLGLTLSIGFFAIYNAYFEYLLTRIRLIGNPAELAPFLSRSLLAALILMLACVPVVFALTKLMPWFVSPQWLEVVPVFVYLAASMALLILQAPLEAACHYLLNPRLVLFGWLTRTVLIAVVGVILAPHMAAVGAAMAQLIGAGFALLLLSYLVARALRNASEAESQAPTTSR